MNDVNLISVFRLLPAQNLPMWKTSILNKLNCGKVKKFSVVLPSWFVLLSLARCQSSVGSL